MSIADEDFLAFLADDISARPEMVKAISPELAKRITALAADIPVRLSDEIDGAVSLCKGESRR